MVIVFVYSHINIISQYYKLALIENGFLLISNKKLFIDSYRIFLFLKLQREILKFEINSCVLTNVASNAFIIPTTGAINIRKKICPKRMHSKTGDSETTKENCIFTGNSRVEASLSVFIVRNM